MQVKKIVMASDHAGCELKNLLKEALGQQGYEILDKGPLTDAQSVDYPDYAFLLAKSLQKKEADVGILLCGSGIGMSIAVNRYPFIRGALVHSKEYAKLSRLHNEKTPFIFCILHRPLFFLNYICFSCKKQYKTE